MQLLIYSNYTDKHTDAGVMPLLACGLKYSTIWLVSQRKPSSRQAVSTVSKSRLQTTPTVGCENKCDLFPRPMYKATKSGFSFLCLSHSIL